jgi:prophage tail gpP-like protein
MTETIVAVAIDGTLFSGWTRAQVRAAVKEAARTFRLEVAAEAGGAITASKFKAGTKIEVRADGDIMLKGHVDSYSPSFDATSAKITISGRSNAADLIDSSPEHKTGHFKQKKLQEIAKELDQQGVGVTVEGEDIAIDWHINPGATIFRELEQIARSKDLVLTGQADGSIKAWTPGKSQKRHAGGIFEGQNLKSGNSTQDWSQRGSKYVVRGQKADGHGVDALELEAVAKDTGVDRNRPIIVVQKESTDKDRIKKRATRTRDRTAGASLTAEIIVQGFRDDGGTLWEPGWLVWIESEFLDLAQDMIIESVDFSLDDSGSTASLSLVDPRAYGGKSKSKGNKSGKTWDQSSDEAELTS